METTDQNTLENRPEVETTSEQHENKDETTSEQRRNKDEIRERILAFFDSTGGGPKKTQEIVEAVSANKGSVSTNLTALVETGEIIKIKRGLYRLNDEGISLYRTAEDNQETINKLLNLYDEVLDGYKGLMQQVLSGGNLEKKVDFLKNFKDLTMIADRLMKRWSLVHIGYDTNSRQAQEDAKLKTEAKKQEALKGAPLKDTVNEVGHFHTDLKELWDNLPEPEKEKYTV